jgi:hypothetical protein
MSRPENFVCGPWMMRADLSTIGGLFATLKSKPDFIGFV